MTLSNIARRTGKEIQQHAPHILTALGVTGIVGTAVMAVKATPEALRRIWDAESEQTEPLTIKQKVRLTWPLYIPAATVGLATAGCIVSSNVISAKRQTALIGAVTLTEKAFKEYRDKVVEQVGKNKEQKVRDEVAKDQIENNNSELVIFGSDNIHCFDTMTGRHFESNVEKLRKAENDLNRQCINEMYASQNDFYRLLDLPSVEIGEELGWNNDNPLELVFSSVLVDDKPVLAVGYRNQPIPNYHKIW